MANFIVTTISPRPYVSQDGPISWRGDQTFKQQASYWPAIKTPGDSFRSLGPWRGDARYQTSPQDAETYFRPLLDIAQREPAWEQLVRSERSRNSPARIPVLETFPQNAWWQPTLPAVFDPTILVGVEALAQSFRVGGDRTPTHQGLWHKPSGAGVFVLPPSITNQLSQSFRSLGDRKPYHPGLECRPQGGAIFVLPPSIPGQLLQPYLPRSIQKSYVGLVSKPGGAAVFVLPPSITEQLSQPYLPRRIQRPIAVNVQDTEWISPPSFDPTLWPSIEELVKSQRVAGDRKPLYPGLWHKPSGAAIFVLPPSITEQLSQSFLLRTVRKPSVESYIADPSYIVPNFPAYNSTMWPSIEELSRSQRATGDRKPPYAGLWDRPKGAAIFVLPPSITEQLSQSFRVPSIPRPSTPSSGVIDASWIKPNLPVLDPTQVLSAWEQLLHSERSRALIGRPSDTVTPDAWIYPSLPVFDPTQMAKDISSFSYKSRITLDPRLLPARGGQFALEITPVAYWSQEILSERLRSISQPIRYGELLSPPIYPSLPTFDPTQVIGGMQPPPILPLLLRRWPTGEGLGIFPLSTLTGIVSLPQLQSDIMPTRVRRAPIGDSTFLWTPSYPPGVISLPLLHGERPPAPINYLDTRYLTSPQDAYYSFVLRQIASWFSSLDELIRAYRSDDRQGLDIRYRTTLADAYYQFVFDQIAKWFPSSHTLLQSYRTPPRYQVWPSGYSEDVSIFQPTFPTALDPSLWGGIEQLFRSFRSLPPDTKPPLGMLEDAWIFSNLPPVVFDPALWSAIEESLRSFRTGRLLVPPDPEFFAVLDILTVLPAIILPIQEFPSIACPTSKIFLGRREGWAAPVSKGITFTGRREGWLTQHFTKFQGGDREDTDVR